MFVLTSKTLEFKKYKETTLLAGFDRDISSLKKVSVKFHTGKSLQPKHKLRILRLRLTPLDRTEKYVAHGDLNSTHSVPVLDLVSVTLNIFFISFRPLCRYDILLDEDKEVSFMPVQCGDATF